MAVMVDERPVFERGHPAVPVWLDVMNLGIGPDHFAATPNRRAPLAVAVVDQLALEDSEGARRILQLRLKHLAHLLGEELVSPLDHVVPVAVGARADEILEPIFTRLRIANCALRSGY